MRLLTLSLCSSFNESFNRCDPLRIDFSICLPRSRASFIESRESSDRWVATVGRGGLMLGPPGEQTSGSLLFCEHYITASVYRTCATRSCKHSYEITLIRNIYCLDYALFYIPPQHAASDAPPPIVLKLRGCHHAKQAATVSCTGRRTKHL